MMRTLAARALVVALATALGARVTVEVPQVGPVPSVPLTFQTLALLVAASWARTPAAPLGALLYVGLGALGVPVLAEGRSGLDAVTGSSLGYLVGFVAAAWWVGRARPRAYGRLFAQQLIAHALILSLGAARLLEWKGLLEAFHDGVRPYLVAGALKSVVGAGLVRLTRGRATSGS